MEITNHKVSDEDISSDKFQESYEFKFSELDPNAKTIYLDPFIDKFLSTNPFKLQQRTYPVDFGHKMAYTYGFQLDLGNDYELAELPQSKKMTLPENTGSYILAISSTGNKVNISLKITFKQPRYAPEFYPSLKEFMNSVLNTQNKTLLTLKKK